jgi:hypothetical protein
MVFHQPQPSESAVSDQLQRLGIETDYELAIGAKRGILMIVGQ